MFLYGANGHGKVVAEIAEENKVSIEAFIDIDFHKQVFLGYNVMHEIPSNTLDMIISIGDNMTRREIAHKNHNINYLTLSHPSANISLRTTIDKGTVIMAGVSINSGVDIGKHCIINTNSSIDHDCKIGDFAHISPNAALAGNVVVGEGTHIGLGASIIQNINIGKWCTIGAGSVILQDIPDGGVVVGNPGRVIKINSLNN
ncbi:acetyltransferase [Chryseobacterium joostei]|uniref:Acetyltransferase n=1 Tax=Chryseobacterium joostei TaxID=112234 RepID=A0A1N7I3Q2_9FLAO|nr:MULTISPECIES: acetyltransferase [Chryseobacterium]AZA99819.1 acetyltransferase [Chryseobacterium joostei]SIS31687.1 acetyltransferase EpsM [Chryseobacterium joostei]HCM33520.1 acetyltransferase [Chryseobacterium sp.]